jgi:hypothetical protein
MAESDKDEIIAPDDPGPKVETKTMWRPGAAQVGLRGDLASVMIAFDPGRSTEQLVELTIDGAAALGAQLAGAAAQARRRAYPQRPTIIDPFGRPIRRNGG